MGSSDPAAHSTNRSVQCPLCELTAGDQSDIYQHLMVSHRKSELSRTVLALLERGPGDTQQDEQSEFDAPELRSIELLS